MTSTGLKLTLEERIRWLEQGVLPRGKSERQLGLLVPSRTGGGGGPLPTPEERRPKDGGARSVSPQEKREKTQGYGKWYLAASDFRKHASERTLPVMGLGGDCVPSVEEEQLLQSD